MKNKREATIWHALIPIVAVVSALSISIIKYEADPHIPMLFGAFVAGIVAIFGLGYTWEEVERGAIETIQLAMQSIIILIIVGTLIGSWLLSGTVPAMIYYGLQILSPGIFLVATTIICAIVAIATGSSWSTAGTIGVALMGVGQGLGIDAPIIAGAIISGAYFGDKMSPLSDTTNLAPAMAGSTLFEHIKYMFHTTVPSLVIALILYAIIGAGYAGRPLDESNIVLIQSAISNSFNISPVVLLPPLIVIILVALKVPAIPGLLSGTILGGIFAGIFQGAGIRKFIESVHYGFSIESGSEIVDELISGGGLDEMMWTVSLILLAMIFGGILERTGMLQAVGSLILKFANSTGSLVTASILTSISINLLAADQYLSVVIPGRMYKPIFDERGLEPRLLSRTLEDAGTLTSALIPWNTCGAFMSTALGVSAAAYAPYAFVNLLTPLVAIFLAYTGIGIIDPNRK